MKYIHRNVKKNYIEICLYIKMLVYEGQINEN